jgi:hypothetical protein
MSVSALEVVTNDTYTLYNTDTICEYFKGKAYIYFPFDRVAVIRRLAAMVPLNSLVHGSTTSFKWTPITDVRSHNPHQQEEGGGDCKTILNPVHNSTLCLYNPF